MKKTLITGISGLLGNNLAFCLKGQYQILGLFNQHPCSIEGIEVAFGDLTNPRELKAVVDSFRPDVVIHCAALSDIDVCETNQELAYKSNVLATRYLVQSIKNTNCQLIYISSDAVYGEHADLIHEESKLDPLSFYAQTKLNAEAETLKHGRSLILRTNIFGWNIQDKFSLGEWVINELKQQHKIKGFKDVQFSSIYTFELAKIIDAGIRHQCVGIYNAASQTHMTKYDFAVRIAQRLGFNTTLIDPVSIDQFPFKAKRQHFMALDVRKMQHDFGVSVPTLERCIDAFVDDYLAEVPARIKAGQVKKIYPQLNFVPYGRQSIDDDDIQSVVDVLKSPALTQGPKVVEFEELICSKIGAKYAIAVNSATSGLHIACLAAGVMAGDEVITSANSFVASANCAIYCGASPIFADIDPATYNMSLKSVEEKITAKTKAIVAVHFAGQSCDMRALRDLVRAKEQQYGIHITLIEDASHALGSLYEGSFVGCCAYSDMAVMSFHPVKHITTGEGGAVFTNSDHLSKLLKRFRSHGITNESEEIVYPQEAFESNADKEVIKRPWYYEQQFLGYNYRITDIACALGITQVRKLDQFMHRRKQIVGQYNQAFKDVDFLTIPYQEKNCESNFHLYVLRIDFKKIGLSRAEVILYLRQMGVQTQVHYIPIYTQPFYQKNFGYHWGECPNAEAYYQECLSIPLFASMSESEVNRVIDLIVGLGVLKDQSRLALGTVQFGLDYGITNHTGKVDPLEALEILIYAHAHRVDLLDTASAYGDSEAVLGKNLSRISPKTKVVTKVQISKGYQKGNIKTEFDLSLSRLRKSSIYGYLIHGINGFLDHPEAWKEMLELKSLGKVSKVGFSVYSPEEIQKIDQHKIHYDIIQFPYSIFDRRFEPFLAQLKQNKVETHARSIFLQGLAAATVEKLPEFFNKAKPQLLALRKISQETGIDVTALCLNFVLLNNQVDRLVMGVDGLCHFQENLAALRHRDAVAVIKSQLDLCQITQENILLPYLWPR